MNTEDTDIERHPNVRGNIIKMPLPIRRSSNQESAAAIGTVNATFFVNMPSRRKKMRLRPRHAKANRMRAAQTRQPRCHIDIGLLGEDRPLTVRNIIKKRSNPIATTMALNRPGCPCVCRPEPIGK